MRQAINIGREVVKQGDRGLQPRGGRYTCRLIVWMPSVVWLLLIIGSATASEMQRIQGELTIFTAASLTDAFQEMAARIEQTNRGTRLTFNFAGSPTLRSQLAHGARADVFASADEPNMDGAAKDGTISGEPRIFARNLLVVIVPVNNPAGIKTLPDLTKPKIKLVLANKDVPAGNYARQALEKMSQDPAFGLDFTRRVLANLASEEMNVKQVAAKVQLGEADAGIVYSTDVTPAMRSAVRVIDIPSEWNVIAKYPIAVVQGTRNESGARVFIEYVLSPAGQAILQHYGFLVAGS
ncbi:MAG TPA: molybdate ABC transporter substrate-binding protein [Candidatus Tectomicrobia bacterium]